MRRSTASSSSALRAHARQVETRQHEAGVGGVDVTVDEGREHDGARQLDDAVDRGRGARGAGVGHDVVGDDEVGGPDLGADEDAAAAQQGGGHRAVTGGRRPTAAR